MPDSASQEVSLPTAGTRAVAGLPTLTVEPFSLSAGLLVIGSNAAAFVAGRMLGSFFVDASPFAPFYVATLAVTILAGFVPGVLSALLGFALAAFLESGAETFTPSAAGYYALLSGAFIWLSMQYRRLLGEVQLREKLANQRARVIAKENRALALATQGKPSNEVMVMLIDAMEEFSHRSMMVSVLYLDDDGKTLHHVAAPSLPDSYNQAIEGAQIGPKAGSCGTAAFRKEQVIVENIDEDPLWEDYRALAQQHGLKACWSTPIFSQAGDVLGTYAVYHREPRRPKPEEFELIQLFVNTASIVIENERSRAPKAEAA